MLQLFFLKMLQLWYLDVAIFLFFTIDECCKKTWCKCCGENFSLDSVCKDIFDFWMLQAVSFKIADIIFICYICYFFILRWSEGASNSSDVRALALHYRWLSFIRPLFIIRQVEHVVITGKNAIINQEAASQRRHTVHRSAARPMSITSRSSLPLA